MITSVTYNRLLNFLTLTIYDLEQAELVKLDRLSGTQIAFSTVVAT